MSSTTAGEVKTQTSGETTIIGYIGYKGISGKVYLKIRYLYSLLLSKTQQPMTHHRSSARSKVYF